MLSLALLFVLVFFSPFSIVIASLGKERAGLCASHAFVYFACINFCSFSLPLGVWGWLQLHSKKMHYLVILQIAQDRYYLTKTHYISLIKII